MQAHREHWDWFRLRHTVGSVEESQSYVEQEFMGRWFVTDVYRTYLDNDRGSDADGWATVVELGGEPPDDGAAATIDEGDDSRPTIPLATGATAGVLLLIGTSLRVRRLDLLDRVDGAVGRNARRALSVAVAIVVTFLLVRFGSVGLERATPLPPKLIAATFYPVVFAGIPAVTYLLARQLDRSFAFSAASLGFLTAVFLDYTYLGVTVLPLDALIHRGGLAVALGFIAVGASRAERLDPEPSQHIRLGVLLWLVTLILPLLRFV